MKQVVRTFLKNKDWKYLMVKHKNKSHWSLPGGHLEQNEDIYKALKREIKEELNLKIKIIWDKENFKLPGIKIKAKPLCVYKIKYCFLKEKEVKKLEYIFLSEIKSWDIIIQETEIDKYNFFSKEEIIEKIETYQQVKILAWKL